MEALTFMPNKSVLDSPICSSLGWHFPVSFIQLYAKQPITVLIISLLTKMVFERTDALVYHPLRFQSPYQCLYSMLHQVCLLLLFICF